MILRDYVDACRQLAQELRESLSSADIQLLRLFLLQMTESQWNRWCVDQQVDVARFVAATPAERVRYKSWSDRQMRAVLTFAAIQHLQRAEALLETIDRHRLVLGGPDRAVAAAAGIAWIEVIAHECLAEDPLPEWKVSFHPDD